MMDGKSYFEKFYAYFNRLIDRFRQLNCAIKWVLRKQSKASLIWLLVSVGLLSIAMGIIFLSYEWMISHRYVKKQATAHFETAPQVIIKANTASPIQPLAKPKDLVPTTAQLQSEIQSIRADLETSNIGMQKAVQMIQTHLTTLPSNTDIAALQANLSKPDQQIASTLDTINHSVNEVVAQTAQKTWVDPKTVEAYFQLVAVQGFSDGMRAVIDVDGHEMTLSVNEECPACRGWQLDQMDFAGQTAVFEKKSGDKTLFVTLRAN